MTTAGYTSATPWSRSGAGTGWNYPAKARSSTCKAPPATCRPGGTGTRPQGTFFAAGFLEYLPADK